MLEAEARRVQGLEEEQVVQDTLTLEMLQTAVLDNQVTVETDTQQILVAHL